MREKGNSGWGSLLRQVVEKIKGSKMNLGSKEQSIKSDNSLNKESNAKTYEVTEGTKARDKN